MSTEKGAGAGADPSGDAAAACFAAGGCGMSPHSYGKDGIAQGLPAWRFPTSIVEIALASMEPDASDDPGDRLVRVESGSPDQ